MAQSSTRRRVNRISKDMILDAPTDASTPVRDPNLLLTDADINALITAANVDNDQNSSAGADSVDSIETNEHQPCDNQQKECCGKCDDKLFSLCLSEHESKVQASLKHTDNCVYIALISYTDDSIINVRESAITLLSLVDWKMIARTEDCTKYLRSLFSNHIKQIKVVDVSCV